MFRATVCPSQSKSQPQYKWHSSTQTQLTSHFVACISQILYRCKVSNFIPYFNFLENYVQIFLWYWNDFDIELNERKNIWDPMLKQGTKMCHVIGTGTTGVSTYIPESLNNGKPRTQRNIIKIVYLLTD